MVKKVILNDNIATKAGLALKGDCFFINTKKTFITIYNEDKSFRERMTVAAFGKIAFNFKNIEDANTVSACNGHNAYL